MAMGVGIVNGGIGKNGNVNKVLSWEWVGMGMTSREWEGMGTAKVIPAHLYWVPVRYPGTRVALSARLDFYPRDAMLARVFAIATCLSGRLSVRLSVCHTPVLCLAERKQDREMYTI